MPEGPCWRDHAGEGRAGGAVPEAPCRGGVVPEGPCRRGHAGEATPERPRWMGPCRSGRDGGSAPEGPRRRDHAGDSGDSGDSGISVGATRAPEGPCLRGRAGGGSTPRGHERPCRRFRIPDSQEIPEIPEIPEMPDVTEVGPGSAQRSQRLLRFQKFWRFRAFQRHRRCLWRLLDRPMLGPQTGFSLLGRPEVSSCRSRCLRARTHLHMFIAPPGTRCIGGCTRPGTQCT